MTLKQFKEHIESFPKGTVFKHGISEPFSWRGVYAEVSFTVIIDTQNMEETLANIQKAYDNEFTGWKGGEYRYNDDTEIHFESYDGSWSDGAYVSRIISEIEGTKIYQSQEERLVNLAFTS